MSRGQGSEFIVMTLLVIVLVIFVVMNRMSSGRQGILQAGESLEESLELTTAMSMSIFPYATIQGHPLDQLMGAATCYGWDKVDYGRGPINVTKEIQKILDQLLGENIWMMDIDGQCITSQGALTGKCKLPDSEFIAADIFYALPCRQQHSNATIYRMKGQ